MLNCNLFNCCPRHQCPDDGVQLGRGVPHGGDHVPGPHLETLPLPTGQSARPCPQTRGQTLTLRPYFFTNLTYKINITTNFLC